MSSMDAFNGVGQAGAPRSEPEQFFRQWRKGELNTSEYQAMTAHWVAEFAHLYQPRPLPILGQAVRDYVEARNADSRARDGAMAFKVGLWLQAVTELVFQNDGDMDLLHWAREIMARHQNPGGVAKLERQADIMRRGLRLPPEYKPAVRCQRLDMEEKRRSVRAMA